MSSRKAHVCMKSHICILGLPMSRKRKALLAVALFLCSLFSCFLVTPSFAQPIASTNIPFTGLSAFPIMNEGFPFEQWEMAMEGAENPALAFVWNTFGRTNAEGTKDIVKFLNTRPNRPHLLEIHMTNQSCYKNLGKEGRQCGAGELVQGIDFQEFNRRILSNGRKGQRLRSKIQRRAANIRQWVDTEVLPEAVNPGNVAVLLSTGLEDQYDRDVYRKIVELVEASGWASGSIVRNPLVNRGAVGPDRYAEFHPGTRALANSDDFKPYPNRGCIANLDGVSTPGPAGPNVPVINANEAKAFIRRHRRCLAVLLWNEPSQGSSSGKTPRERTFTISNEDRDSIRGILASLSSANP